MNRRERSGTGKHGGQTPPAGHGKELGAAGFEPCRVTSCNDNALRGAGAAGGAESGAVGRQPTPDSADLQRVVAAWPGLPEHVRAAILTLATAGNADVPNKSGERGGKR